jgi:Flp pilus assembly protein TadD
MPPDELAALAPQFSEAIARSPQLAQLLRNCVALAAWLPAVAIAKRMIAADPSHQEAHALLARSEIGLARGVGVGRNDPCPCGSGKRYKQCHGALGSAPAAVSATPDDLVRRGMAAHQRGDLDAAARDYRDALASMPEHPHALHYLGVVEYQQGRPAAALAPLERAAAQVPHEPEFHNNLGLVHAALDRNADAIASYRRAIALKPDHASAWNNLGLALQADNDVASAADAFRRALAIAPAFTRARWNLALALLADGRFAEGWAAYEARLDVPEFAPASVPPTPRWNGRDAAGRHILLTAEQGLGDAIQFVRLVPRLAALGAHVVVQAPRPLAHLFRTVDSVTQVVAQGDPLPTHDAWLPLLSLAGVLGVTGSSLPGPVPYLAADAQWRAEAADALAPHARSLRVGLAWAGNPRHANDRRRSAPLAALAPLLELPGIVWFSLQKGNGEEQAAQVPAARRLIALPMRDDFDVTAALVDELDLVVSVDTSIAHLAGALGRTVFVLLPFASDWRWRIGRSDSDWYPTARLFRQRVPGDWGSAVEPLRAALASMRNPRS